VLFVPHTHHKSRLRGHSSTEQHTRRTRLAYDVSNRWCGIAADCVRTLPSPPALPAAPCPCSSPPDSPKRKPTTDHRLPAMHPPACCRSAAGPARLLPPLPLPPALNPSDLQTAAPAGIHPIPTPTCPPPGPTAAQGRDRPTARTCSASRTARRRSAYPTFPARISFRGQASPLHGPSSGLQNPEALPGPLCCPAGGQPGQSAHQGTLRGKCALSHSRQTLGAPRSTAHLLGLLTTKRRFTALAAPGRRLGRELCCGLFGLLKV
jgi:hypothetical protein